MATPTYVPIETYTLGSAASSVTFGAGNTLPQTYTDLVIVIQGIQESSYSARNMGIRFNGDSGTNYSSIQILSASSGADANINNAYGPLINSSVNTTSGSYSNVIINVQNYSNNTTYKTVINRGGSAASYTSGGTNVGVYQGINACTWRNTAPITEITVYAVAPNQAGSGANWSAGSTFTLYGIANAAIGAPKATGGIITYDNTYYYHTFGASGTFTPQQSLTADVLLVAGGGGSGRANMTNNNGGAGAGGYRLLTSQSLTTTAYTVQVGAGGAGATVDGNPGSKGGNSYLSGSGFTTITSTGGGYSHPNSTPGTGGSGGGGGSFNSQTGAAGNEGGYTPVEGYAGGQGRENNNYPAGGGGGAGGVGGTPANSTSNGGAGGIGSSTASSWGLVTGTGENISGTVYYAGGGGGGVTSLTAGAGGYGGGGAGSNNLATNNGLTNTGGGAGGSGGTPGQKNGANGGSGVVIIRYLKA